MTELSTAAWVLHDLGLAANFGGNLFGQLALNPAVQSLDDVSERGKVVHRAWDGFKIANAVALGTMATTWLVGRTMLSGREVSRDARTLTLVKDGLVAGAVVTGIGSMVLGSQMAKAGDNIPITSGLEPAPETPERVRKLQIATNIVGIANTLLVAGVIGVTAALAMHSGQSARWSFMSRLLP